jgi:hypothetical protein
VRCDDGNDAVGLKVDPVDRAAEGIKRGVIRRDSWACVAIVNWSGDITLWNVDRSTVRNFRGSTIRIVIGGFIRLVRSLIGGFGRGRSFIRVVSGSAI